MIKCFVCGKEIKDLDIKEIFGLDGDFIHKNCKQNADVKMDKINKMSDKQFYNWMMPVLR